jgi:FkbM family methyltransferase
VDCIRNFIKTMLRDVFGLEVSWTRDFPSAAVRLDTMNLVSTLQVFGIDCVLDIGANQGQFASGIRRCGYAGRIISFEPLTSAHKALLSASAGDALWEIYPRCALGERTGEAEINIAGNSESSSMLPMLEAHRRAAPQSAYLGKEVVKVRTLDEVAAPYLEDARAVFLKIDTQGFEWQVLDGARATLPHVKGILVELSLLPLYEGQHLWREVIARLETEGYTLWALKPVFSDMASGRTLQMDGIFYRD